ncbi:metalloregulator ArsR/SmtB family transcription factor [Paractinoplanes rishiriensis]|nr:metalloregulator ArsR/SmtB family transcription factor [Actinoplanes rishiriensis]
MVELDAVFHALAHQVRRSMLRRLATGELTIGELAEPLQMSLAAASKHVKVLELAGLVGRTVDGRRHVCRLEPRPLSEATAWLLFYEEFRDARLPALRTLPAVHREMILPAAAHPVYRAWLTPDVLRQWLAPGPYECVRAEVDERVGGHFRIWHSTGGEPAGGFEAEILDLAPDRRIAWRWGFVGPDRSAGGFDSLLTVTLEDTADGGTHLILRHERLDDLAAAMPEVAAGVGAGWNGALEKLTSALKVN